VDVRGFIEHQVEHGSMIRAACKACNVPDRGANPIAAAEFVWRIAQSGQDIAPEASGPAAPSMLAFIRQGVTFNVVDGAAVVQYARTAIPRPEPQRPSPSMVMVRT